MTKEEALKIQYLVCDSNLLKESEKLIEQIYDDFESRTCETCKHHEDIGKSYKACTELNINTGIDFSCSLWESKER